MGGAYLYICQTCSGYEAKTGLLCKSWTLGDTDVNAGSSIVTSRPLGWGVLLMEEAVGWAGAGGMGTQRYKGSFSTFYSILLSNSKLYFEVHKRILSTQLQTGLKYKVIHLFKGCVAIVFSLHQRRLIPRREIHGSTHLGAARTSDITQKPPRQRADTQRSNPRSSTSGKLLNLCEPGFLHQ